MHSSVHRAVVCVFVQPLDVKPTMYQRFEVRPTIHDSDLPSSCAWTVGVVALAPILALTLTRQVPVMYCTGTGCRGEEARAGCCQRGDPRACRTKSRR